MPRVVTREERIQRLVAKTRKRVDANSDGSRSLSQAPDSLLGTLVREAGYERSSTKLLETLEQSFLDADIATYPEITDPGNSAKTRIHFSTGTSEIRDCRSRGTCSPKRRNSRDS